MRQVLTETAVFENICFTNYYILQNHALNHKVSSSEDIYMCVYICTHIHRGVNIVYNIHNTTMCIYVCVHSMNNLHMNI
jgi:hypothetical protein